MAEKMDWRRVTPSRDNLLEILHIIDDQNRTGNYLPNEEIEEVARYMKIPRAELDGVISFYTLFSRKKRGKYVLRLCDSLSCRIRGSLDLCYYLQKNLGLRKGETTSDGLFSLEIVNCLGHCETAPNILVNQTLYSNLTEANFEEILFSLKKGGMV